MTARSILKSPVSSPVKKTEAPRQHTISRLDGRLVVRLQLPREFLVKRKTAEKRQLNTITRERQILAYREWTLKEDRQKRYASRHSDGSSLPLSPISPRKRVSFAPP